MIKKAIQLPTGWERIIGRNSGDHIYHKENDKGDVAVIYSPSLAKIDAYFTPKDQSMEWTGVIPEDMITTKNPEGYPVYESGEAVEYMMENTNITNPTTRLPDIDTFGMDQSEINEKVQEYINTLDPFIQLTRRD